MATSAEQQTAPPINPKLYVTPPDIDGSTPEQLMAGLHLLEHRWFMQAIRKILGAMEERIKSLERIPRGYVCDATADDIGDDLPPGKVQELSDTPSRDDIIRDQYADGMTYAEIAKLHDISPARVGQIVKKGT